MPLLKSEKAANAKTCLNQNKQGGGKECSRQGTKGGGHDAARRSKEGLIQVSECNLDEGDPFFDSCSRCSFALMQWVKLQDFAVLLQCRMTRNATCALRVGASETRVVLLRVATTNSTEATKITLLSRGFHSRSFLLTDMSEPYRVTGLNEPICPISPNRMKLSWVKHDCRLPWTTVLNARRSGSRISTTIADCCHTVALAQHLPSTLSKSTPRCDCYTPLSESLRSTAKLQPESAWYAYRDPSARSRGSILTCLSDLGPGITWPSTARAGEEQMLARE
ncbi:hypothetical protein NDA11_006110 [Ustilago hordei]|uniref:Uncharacterized protein n=1 Tax=Ustilago hordei TaxID=120017 RepID=I2G3W6_USTHO|nr:uncharacterized protein UHO2_00951 [Ustilago hordei]KAJ1037522.1 hypothetical protein NDA10_000777 [Ustilago hordei]KAJ1583560.1 hypothetical protein NDA15_004754 [Ustilago hordei]KAJ1584742.1 hypothetical protein NDA11_006110 [Ustilago hordei]KAJ1592144.1 hypothetical protein NDA12_005989 [Ustilago hordei]KAJ1602939.1 hypothetical protein NDA14_002165 [Ustilago hordei]